MLPLLILIPLAVLLHRRGLLLLGLAGAAVVDHVLFDAAWHARRAWVSDVLPRRRFGLRWGSEFSAGRLRIV